MIAAALCSAAAALSGCAVSGTYMRPGAETSLLGWLPDSIDTRLILIGDAGKPRLPGPEPVFVALANAAAHVPERTWIVFLGDNIYPHGLVATDAPDRAAAEAALRAQVDVALATGAQVVFVPGNHDYAADGWPGLQRERAYLEAIGNPRLRALPAGGCPGPEVVDAGERARLVFLDSQWWFQDGLKPRHPTSACAADTVPELRDALRTAVESAGDRHVVVMAHHPLATHGSHGGFFSWRQHVFPLTDSASWAWIPLPIIGSLYPLARQHGITEQDLSDPAYEAYIEAVAGVLREHPVLAFAAGHEHSLQVLQLPGTTVHIVSGAGTVARPENVGKGDDTLLATSDPGFVVLDLKRDGGVRLRVVEVQPDGATEERTVALPER